ncbi:MAG: cytochrome c3 family protein, partial [Bacteroidales bacterium]|nr:cytochrome c3 family protein [Bacteroidales bacterium]
KDLRNKHIIILCINLLICQFLSSQSVVNSVHNLSASGPGSIRALSEQEVCVFCHTPHSARPNSPLWNKNDPGVFYNLYTSSSNQSVPNQPTGSSLLCLSCHDGTIALGSVLNRATDIDFSGGTTMMPPGSSVLSTDLSDDHPVSFAFNSALAANDGQLIDPALITAPVSFENGKLECTSCHDPHRNIYSNFLLVSNQFSELCYKCHDRNYWPSSSHNTSSSVWNGSGNDPWFHSDYNTVAENACENCHNPHSAEGKQGLLNYLAEESNCLVCHNSNVANTNIETQLSKPYLHNVYGYNLSHLPTEDPLVTTMHVECIDCHNPHAANNTAASAPAIPGSLYGSKGVNLMGGELLQAVYEYEVCFRCHADSPGKPGSSSTRLIEQNNTRLEFDPANPSYHPVAAPGQNSDSPSLIAPYSESSLIYCSDCHSSDGAGSPAGPHGSNWPHILKLRYETTDYTEESVEAYALCYSCHSRSSILNDESFGYHYLHIVERDSPCNACHDPHGISVSQGTTTNNTHLINFNTSIVSAGGGGAIRFVDTGTHSGYCMLRCHTRGHGPGMSY